MRSQSRSRSSHSREHLLPWRAKPPCAQGIVAVCPTPAVRDGLVRKRAQVACHSSMQRPYGSDRAGAKHLTRRGWRSAEKCPSPASQLKDAARLFTTHSRLKQIGMRLPLRIGPNQGVRHEFPKQA
jgi:hypothetical protein